MINVLIVEDSLVIQEFLKHILEIDEDIRVIGVAKDGEEAVALAAEIEPDTIIMDINLPKTNGLEATRRIMENNPRPVILVSASHNPEDYPSAFMALETGAATLLEKPMGLGSPGYEDSIKNLIQTVKSVSKVTVGSNGSSLNTAKGRDTETISKVVSGDPIQVPLAGVELVVIGTSAGGPAVLREILSGLTGNFPIPVVITQHFVVGFTRDLVSWLEQTTGFPVDIASQGQSLLPGHAYIAPDGFQTGVTPDRQIFLSANTQATELVPSVDFLFLSAAEVFGSKVIGILLTGMGSDGIDGLKLLKEKGAMTIAQNEETSLAFGMPGRAIESGAVQYILTPEQIVHALLDIGNSYSLKSNGKL